MKRVFDLGMSVVPIRGLHRHLELVVEFGGQAHRKPDEGYFSIMGEVGRGRRWVYAGQCQKKVREICEKKWHKLLDDLLALYDKYSLFYCKCIPTKDAERIIEIINTGV